MKKLIYAAILTCLGLNARAQVNQQIDSTPSPTSAWQPVNLGQRACAGISFVNPQLGWAALDFNGSISQMEKTTDGGLNWSPIGPTRFWDSTGNGNDSEYARPYFYDSLHGLASGGYVGIIQTSDGGQSWHLISPGVHLPSGFFALSPTILFTVGSGSLSRSTDGGQSWTTYALGDGMAAFTSIAKFDSTHLITVGGQSEYFANTPIHRNYYAPLVYISSDAGATWVQDSFWIPYGPPGTSDSIGFSTIVTLDTSTALAFTNNALWRTTDHAITWQRISMGTTTILSASFINSKTAWRVG